MQYDSSQITAAQGTFTQAAKMTMGPLRDSIATPNGAVVLGAVQGGIVDPTTGAALPPTAVQKAISVTLAVAGDASSPGPNQQLYVELIVDPGLADTQTLLLPASSLTVHFDPGSGMSTVTFLTKSTNFEAEVIFGDPGAIGPTTVPATPLPFGFISGTTATPGAVTVRWLSSVGATTYSLAVAAGNDPTCAKPLQSYSGMVQTSKTLATLSQGSYTICVTATNAAGGMTVETAPLTVTGTIASPAAPKSAPTSPSPSPATGTHSEAGSSTNTGTAATALAAPANLVAVAGAGQVSLTWTAIDGATSYVLYWTTPGASPGCSGSNSLNASTASFTQAGLVNGQAYAYVVKAVGSGIGDSPCSAPATATPMDALPAPTAVFAVPGYQVVHLSWGAVTGATSYTVYWQKSGPGVTTSSSHVVVSASPVAFTSESPMVSVPLTDLQTYYFAISATGAAGEGLLSTEVTATPQHRVLATCSFDLWATNESGAWSHPTCSTGVGSPAVPCTNAGLGSMQINGMAIGNGVVFLAVAGNLGAGNAGVSGLYVSIDGGATFVRSDALNSGKSGQSAINYPEAVTFGGGTLLLSTASEIYVLTAPTDPAALFPPSSANLRVPNSGNGVTDAAGLSMATSGQYVYLSGVQTELFRSSDFGANFTIVNPDTPAAITYANGLDVYGFDGNGNVYTSTNGAVTFSQPLFNNPGSVSFLTLDAKGKIFAVASNGVFTSTDAGVTFAGPVVPAVATYVYASLGNPDDIYVSGAQDGPLAGGVANSTDEGVTWSSMTNSPGSNCLQVLSN